MNKLNEIQQKLKVPKSHRNTFANYDYRNAEDILEAVKPLLGSSILYLTDEPIIVGDWHYIKATATFADGERAYTVSAYAREPLSKKGSDESQITGAASSYARKYALNGLFLIDDTKDADHEDNSKPALASQKPATATKPADGDEGLKIKMAQLVSDLGHKGLKGEVLIAKLVELTDLEVVRENYREITSRLETLKEERSQQ